MFLSPKKMPLHLALTMHGIKAWSEKKELSLNQAYETSFSLINEFIKFQVDNKIRIFSIYIIPETMKDTIEITDQFINFLSDLKKSEIINNNQIKVSVLGKWYNLPNRAIDPIKEVISETKDYDNFFLNLCINYSGQEEIVDSVKIIAKKIISEKIESEQIDKEMIKENLYSSYFIPPNILIKTGIQKKTFGFLLWDSVESQIYFTEKLFPDCNVNDLLKGINEWN